MRELGKKIPISKKTIDDGNDKITVSGFGKYRYENGEKTKRYLLEINIENIEENNCLNVIMFNPSEAKTEYKNGKFISEGEFFVDSTITNIIKIAKDNKYNSIKVYNLFPKITSEPNIITSDKDDMNTKYIVESMPENSDILIAWGAILKDRKWINEIKKELYEKLKKNNLFTFCANKNKNFPKHPANIDIDCCRNCYTRSGKIKLKPLDPKQIIMDETIDA